MIDTLVALGRNGAEPDSREILSPAVGRYTDAPPVGTYLSPGAPLGEFRILNARYRLVTPDGVSGLVREAYVDSPRGVEYGEPLLLVARSGDLPAAADAETTTAAAEEDIPEGATAIRAQTDGIFYRRPSPDEPEYVSEGEEVESGRILGLVEVMKCFNQVKSPAAGKVVRVMVDDSAEVRHGQALFLIE